MGEGDVVPVVKEAGEDGQARYTYRLRVSSRAHSALLAEWDRCRWVWNECVAKSKAVHGHNRAHPEDKQTCGPARLDKMLTQAREHTPWLRAGSSVPQQQIIRDFGKSRAKAQKDMRERLPLRQRAGMPAWKKKREADPTLNYGDGAHAMPPMLGQGGNQAIEDAIVLAAHCDALAAYTAARLPRTTAIARQSVKVARMNLMSSRAAIAVRNTAIAALSKAGPALLLRSFDSIADWRPPQQPYASGRTPAGNR